MISEDIGGEVKKLEFRQFLLEYYRYTNLAQRLGDAFCARFGVTWPELRFEQDNTLAKRMIEARYFNGEEQCST